MINIRTFSFNPFQVNSYLVYDETGEGIIIDPGCYGSGEEDFLRETIGDLNITLISCLNTHTHIDHILGNHFIFREYGLRPRIHKEGLQYLLNAHSHGEMFGLDPGEIVKPDTYIADNQLIEFGNSSLEALYTPGHAEGSLCFLSRAQKFLFSGDVLFYGSIGRTDLPGGDYEVLENSIRTVLYRLDEDIVVYPGHGPQTTIGEEKRKNPFVRG